MQISLEGKVALVTGASKGIGRAIAGSMAEAGANVMLSSRKQDQLEVAAAEIAASGAAGETAVFAANAGDVDSAKAAMPPLSNVSADSTSSSTTWPRTRTSAGRWVSTRGVRQDVSGQSARRRSSGARLPGEHAIRDSPLAPSSMSPPLAACAPKAGLGVYNLTKAALIHLTRQLASELGPTLSSASLPVS